MKLKISRIVSLFFIFSALIGYSQPKDNVLIGKVFCGYQGWFNCKGDGSPRDTWVHWGGNPPSPGNLSFEVYPDVSDYAPSSLFQTGFSNFPDGQPSRLFSSYKKDVIDVHCAWMEKYGIDGVALQRFLGPVLNSASIKENRDSVAARLKRSSEKHGTLYYLMYDMSPDNVDGFKGDVIHMENDIKFMDSPNYAHQNGKPVICLWGIGFDHRDGDGYSANSQTIIDWLHGKGYYVIGGVPSRWTRTDGEGDVALGYEQVFASLDMISPWTPGRYRHVAGADQWKNDFLVPDKAKCDELGIDYQPVIFSGFAWSNWNGGGVNDYPRHKGEFLWAQIQNIVDLEIPSIYVAMFDEYDEGTNIMKMADSYLGIPTDQYFLTSSADGSYISSDFYLRLVGKGARVLKGQDPVTPHVTIPFSEGPIYFRTSIEPGYDALPDWTDTQDELGSSNVSGLTCGHVSENPHTGSYSIKITGSDNSTSESSAAMKVFDVNIPVFNDTKLKFMSYPANDISTYATVDLVLTDGTTLSSTGAKDTKGQPMTASTGRGEVNQWSKTICRIGEWLDTTAVSRDTIDKIIIVYDHAAETGEIEAYFDDISIYRMETDEVQIDNASFDTPDIKTQMDPGETLNVSLTINNTGTSPWSAASGYRIASVNPENNLLWGINRIEFGQDTVLPDNKKTISFNITAPDSLGKFSFQWQLIKEIEGEEPIYIGEKSENVIITVGNFEGTSFSEIYDGIITRRAEIHSGEGAEKAFDNLYTEGEKNIDWSKWLDDGGIPTTDDPSWIQIEFPDAVNVDLFSIVSGNDIPARDPENFTLKASNDNVTWTDLMHFEGLLFSSRFQEVFFSLDNTSNYRYYRLEISKNKGNETMTQLCELRLIKVGVFLSLAGKASDPVPANNAETIDVDAQISWTSGKNADSHDVYFGATNPPEYKGNQTDSILLPENLQHNTTYYWRINELNSDGTKVGDIWSFTTKLPLSNAEFVGQYIPNDTLMAGKSALFEVTFKNTGESSWSSGDGQFMLSSQNPENNNTWSISDIKLESDEVVEPGQEKSFPINITAPETPGIYDFQWQMRNIEGWFGDLTQNVTIVVEKASDITISKENKNIVILNPENSGIIHVNVDNRVGPVEIEVFNLEGVKILHSKSTVSHTKVDVSTIGNGIYLVKVKNNKQMNIARILVR